MLLKFEIVNPWFTLKTEVEVSDKFDKIWFLDFMNTHWNAALWLVVGRDWDDDTRGKILLNLFVNYFDGKSPFDISIEWGKEFSDKHSFQYL